MIQDSEVISFICLISHGCCSNNNINIPLTNIEIRMLNIYTHMIYVIMEHLIALTEQLIKGMVG